MTLFNKAKNANNIDGAGPLDGTEIIEISQGDTGKAIVMSQIHNLGLTPVDAVGAAGKLTSSGAMVPATHAVTTLTSDATNQNDGDLVTIGTTVYRFKATTLAAYDVKIGASAAASLDNLKAAINASGTGDGTDYHAGTLVHPDVVATTNADTTQVIQAKVPGTVANAIVTTESGDHTSWAGGTMNSGTPGVTDAAAKITIGTRTYTVVDELSETAADAIVDQILYGADEAEMLDNLKVAINAGATAGTNYSTGTVVNADVSAGTNTDTTQVVTAKIKGTHAHAIAITTTMANHAWDAAVLGTEVAGIDGTIGKKGQCAFDATNFYICKVDSGTADTGNWRKIAHSAL